MPPTLKWPSSLAAMEPHQRRVTLALGLSLFFHAVLLSIHFKLPQALDKVRERALEVILVNSESAQIPQQAQARAQANLDSGGNVDEPVRAKTPLPPTTETAPGDALLAAQQRVAELEAQQREIMTGAARTQVDVRRTPEKDEQQTPGGGDVHARALDIARMEAEIARSIEAYNQRPKRKFIGARAKEYRFARYVERWRQKVERIGNLNYPQEARGKLYGNLLMTVAIKKDGLLERVEVDRSSGHALLDAAALRIVRMAAPFQPFPQEISRDTDILEITRTWYFTSDQLHSE